MIDFKNIKKETWYLILVGIVSFCLVCIYFYFNFFSSGVIKDENGTVLNNDASPMNLSVPNAGVKNDSLSVIDKIEKLKEDSITKARINNVGYVENDISSSNSINSKNTSSELNRNIPSNRVSSGNVGGSTYSSPSRSSQSKRKNTTGVSQSSDNINFSTESNESFFDTPKRNNAQTTSSYSGSSSVVNNEEAFTDKKIYACIHNNQIIKDNSRIKIRLTKNTMIDGVKYPTNTIIYGLAKLQQNRMLIDITSVNQNKINDLEVFDAEDSNKGIYVETPILNASLKKEVGNEALQEDLSNVPFSRTLSSFLQKKIKEERIELLDNYKLIIKKKTE